MSERSIKDFLEGANASESTNNPKAEAEIVKETSTENPSNESGKLAESSEKATPNSSNDKSTQEKTISPDKPTEGSEDLNPSNSEPKRSVISELSEGKFESAEDLYKAWREAEESKVELPEHIKTQLELEKKGIKVTPELLKDLSTNWSELDPKNPEHAKSMIRAKMKIDNPTYDNEEIDFKMRKYNYDEKSRREELSERYDESKVEEIINREKNDLNQELSINAKGAISTLKEYQSKLQKPEGLDTQVELEKQNKSYYDTVNKVMGDFKSIPITIGKDEVNHEVSKEVATKISSALTNLVKDYPAFWQEVEGIEGLRNALAFYADRENIIKSISKRVGSEKIETIVGEFNNQESRKNQSGSPAIMSEADQIAKQMGWTNN